MQTNEDNKQKNKKEKTGFQKYNNQLSSLGAFIQYLKFSAAIEVTQTKNTIQMNSWKKNRDNKNS